MRNSLYQSIPRDPAAQLSQNSLFFFLRLSWSSSPFHLAECSVWFTFIHVHTRISQNNLFLEVLEVRCRGEKGRSAGPENKAALLPHFLLLDKCPSCAQLFSVGALAEWLKYDRNSGHILKSPGKSPSQTNVKRGDCSSGIILLFFLSFLLCSLLPLQLFYR